MDDYFLLLINGCHNTWLNSFMWHVTGTLPWLLFFASLLWIVVKNNGTKSAVVIILCIALMILLTDQTCATLLKPYFARLRPTHEPSLAGQVQLVNGYMGGMYSFPSNHAANTFAVATFMSLLVCHWRMSAVCFAWALLSCFSRVYLGVHYPSDILCGAMLGALVGFSVGKLCVVATRKAQVSRPHWYSTLYTSTGYPVDDIYVVSVAFVVTLVAMVF